MSSMAKSTRAAMKAKAARMGSNKGSGKVDASGWSPSEPLNTETKTGMRPISRRAFKKGGKVKTYAKGGSVKGSGCERRGLRKCKVY